MLRTLNLRCGRKVRFALEFQDSVGDGSYYSPLLSEQWCGALSPDAQFSAAPDSNTKMSASFPEPDPTEPPSDSVVDPVTRELKAESITVRIRWFGVGIVCFTLVFRIYYKYQERKAKKALKSAAASG